MAAARIAVITGGNKGLGYEITKKIGHSEGWLAILAARDQNRGRDAAERLISEGAGVRFRNLDITKEDSRKAFKQELEQEHGKLDCLVNNAGFAFKGADPTPFEEQAEPTMNINFFSTVALTEELLPLVKRSDAGRIVNVCSQSGYLKIIPDGKLRAKFASAGEPGGLSKDELIALAHKFVEDVKSGKHKEFGWPNTCYGMSKLCLIAYTKILAAQEPSLRINGCCPGYTATDMTGGKGRSAEEGARTPYMLAVKLANDDKTGGFWVDEKEVEW